MQLQVSFCFATWHTLFLSVIKNISPSLFCYMCAEEAWIDGRSCFVCDTSDCFAVSNACTYKSTSWWRTNGCEFTATYMHIAY